MHALKDEVAQLARENEKVKNYIAYSTPTEQDREVGNYDKEGFVDLDG